MRESERLELIALEAQDVTVSKETIPTPVELTAQERAQV